MQTILITISRGAIARNILQNECYAALKRQFQKVVIITPAAYDERFKKEFDDDNVEVVAMPADEDDWCDRIILRLNRYLIFSESTVGRGLYWYITVPSRLGWLGKYIRFTVLRLVFQPLSKLTFLRRGIQWFDYYFLQRRAARQYEQLIEKYRPAVVFATSILEEAPLLKAAKRLRVPTVAMPKTWDNPSKVYFRARADRIVAWSPYMKEQLLRLQDYRPDQVDIVGVPQFDYYRDESCRESRDNFCRRVGLDPRKKILFFGSEGKVMTSDADIAVVLYDFVRRGELNEDCQLFIRPHFGYRNDGNKFAHLAGKPGVVIDSFNNPSSGFRDNWDYSTEHMRHFFNTLYHADIVINTASTLTLDAAAISRPVILITFDGYEKKSFYAGSARWYVCDYYRELLRYKPALIADSVASLRESINRLLRQPSLLKDNQQRLCERFCFAVDGRSGRRCAEAVVRTIHKTL